MIAVIKNFCSKILHEENKKRILIDIIAYLIIAEAVVSLVYMISDIHSKEEICQKLKTDITDIVGNSKDIKAIDLSEFEKISFNVNNISNDTDVINLSYLKEEISAKISQTYNGIEISVFIDTNYNNMILGFIVIPILFIVFIYCITETY